MPKPADAGSPDPRTLTGRLRIALKEWEKRQPDVSQTVIGEQVGAILGEAVDQKKVSRWFNGQEPTLAELQAIAQFFGVDPCALAFGEPDAGKGRGRARTLPRRGPSRPGDEERRA